MSSFKEGWFVLYTKPHHEMRVAEALRELSIDFYLPLVKSLRRWGNRNRKIDVPIFHSYVFIYLKGLKDYYEGLKPAGVVKYLKFGDEFARVDKKVIVKIQEVVKYGESIEVKETYSEVERTSSICDGPLKGLSCEIIDSGRKQFLIVRVKLLGRQLTASVPRACVQLQN